MAWLESHGNLARHPKTRRLMQRMGWTLPTTIGNLHLLWWWALDFAPTGNITRFEPEQITYDLDLNGATPEQFLEAMIHAGFIDRSEDSLRLHDWPEYTAKSLRPKFRRNPERWHQVLRSYGLPVITCTSRRNTGVSIQEQPTPSRLTGAGRSDQTVARDSQAIRRDSSFATAESENGTAIAQKSDTAESNVPRDNPANQPEQQTEPAAAFDLPTAEQMANMHRLRGEYEPQGAVRIDCVEERSSRGGGREVSGGERSQVPRSLSLVPGFVEVWWPKLLWMYKNKSTPLDSIGRRDILARLQMRPNSSVRLLKHCVENSLDCKWEHLENTS